MDGYQNNAASNNQNDFVNIQPITENTIPHEVPSTSNTAGASTIDNSEKTDEGSDSESGSENQKPPGDPSRIGSDSSGHSGINDSTEKGDTGASGEPPKKKQRAPRNTKKKFKNTHNPYSYYYFDSNDCDAVKCSTCPRTYKPSTRIDTLVRHLSKKHGVTSSAAIASGRSNPFLLPGTGLPPSQSSSTVEERTQMEEAVVNWILEDSLKLSAIETPAFLRLFRLAAPAAPLPTIQRLREIFNTMLEEAPQPRQLTDFNIDTHLLQNPFTMSANNNCAFDSSNSLNCQSFK